MTLPGRAANRAFVPPANEAYSYDGAGNLVSTTYSDDTPSIACAYDRSGNIVSAVTDGVATNFYAYSAEGLVTNEVQNGATLARSYDSLGRPTGYTLSLCASASLREVSFSYDALGRLFTVASGTNLFTYSYLLGTDLVSGYTCGGFSRSVAYEPYRDLVLAITNRFGSRIISTFEYTNDAAGRRTAIKRGGEAMGPLVGSTDAYGYNGRNEVVSARRTLGGESVAGFNEDFAYDPIGNRVSATDYDETGAARTSLYAANALNQYISRTVPGWASVRGLADADATVAVNGNPAYMVGRAVPSAPNPDDLAYFFGSDDFDNSIGGGFAELEVSATISDGTNDFVSVVTNKVFVPPANETYAYDVDGNQTFVTTGTGAWQVEYNGENRPVRWTCVSPDSPTPNSSTPTLISMAYDHMGRRRFYVEQKGNVVGKRHVFTYDGYLQIARNRVADADFGVGDDAFLWDPTEPIATRPLASSLSTSQALNSSTFFYALDGNKNVTELIDADGAIVAHYEYSAFGKTLQSLSADGSADRLNPWRFSSEYADDATRLVYYNYRHYEPGMGRWLNRDLIGEHGGADLYGFVRNEATQYVDLLGLWLGRPNLFTKKGHTHQEITHDAYPVHNGQLGQCLSDKGDKILIALIDANVSTDSDDATADKQYYHYCTGLNKVRDEFNGTWDYDGYKNKYTETLKEEKKNFDRGITTPNQSNCDAALKALGRLTHMWQDYYSHGVNESGWFIGDEGDIKGSPDDPKMQPVSYGWLGFRGGHGGAFRLLNPFTRVEPGDRAADSENRRTQAVEFVKQKLQKLLPEWSEACCCEWEGN